MESIFAPFNCLSNFYFRFESANSKITEWSDQTGIAMDQLRYVLCLFMVYPLALIYRKIPSATFKHTIDVIVGVLIAQLVLQSAWIHSFITSTITYFLLCTLPPAYAPVCVFIFNFSYLSASHLYRLYVDYMGWTLDFTGPQMLLTMKLTSLAFNYSDGKQSQKGAKSHDKALASRQQFAIRQLPTPIQFYGYVYNFTTFLAGPAFEFREYLDTTTEIRFRHKNAIQRPSNAFAVSKKCAIGVLCMALYAHFGSMFPISNFYSDKIASKPLFPHLWTLYLTLLLVKFKYYGAWKVAEGAAVLANFGFEGFHEDGSPRGWDGINNMDIIGFELSPSIRQALRAWNKGTQNWLERYVYSRTNNSLIATYFVSAFWHGFYPGYYLFFLSLPLATTVNRLAYKRIRPYFVNGKLASFKWMYDAAGTFASVMGMLYFVIPFQVDFSPR
ncbi:unnamed protein product [Albugo candida]|uniref:Uncharacterized protein n=1 Tax=Albugo candida TaxID=65357 RepID=A0A024G8E6_9STRA|nr:unnamed protein product [Albugo candida]|eukprot:CCI43023.1 unnamed protein product [Albugo candida]